MTDNNQVWAVSTPGAPHDASLARKASYANTGGVTGIIAASNPGVGLTPGTPMSVRLDPCSLVAASTYPGHTRESYTFDIPDHVDVPITTTGSSSRYDVIALVVSDPILEGQDVMEIGPDGEPVEGSTGLDPRDYDYWEARVFTSVPSSARRSPDAFRDWAQRRNDVHGPVVPYALVSQGPNSVGLEGKVTPFFDSVLGRRSNIIVDQPIDRTYTLTGQFSRYKTLGPSLKFDTPWWATRARVKATVQGFRAYRAGGGRRRGLANGLAFGKSMRSYWWDARHDSAWDRQTLMVWADLAISSSRRGQVNDFRLRVTSRDAEAELQLDDYSHMFLEVEFLEDPNAVDNSDPELEE